MGGIEMTAKICKNCKKAKSTHKGYELWCDVEGLEPVLSDTIKPKIRFYYNEKSVDSNYYYGQQLIKEGKKRDDKYFKFVSLMTK